MKKKFQCIKNNGQTNFGEEKDIKDIKKPSDNEKVRWPMIILRTPKGWTGPKEVDGKIIEGSFRAHQVPISMEKEEHLSLLEAWLRSYRPEELFDENGTLIKELQDFCPKGNKRMGASIYTNGGYLRKDLIMPDFSNYAVDIPYPGSVKKQDMLVLSSFIRDIFKLNKENKNFRIFGPDETMSNRLYDVFDETSFLSTCVKECLKGTYLLEDMDSLQVMKLLLE